MLYEVITPYAALCDRETFPQAVQPERHEIIHEIVALGYRIEYPGYQARLGRLRNILEAEMRGSVVAASGHYAYLGDGARRWCPAFSSFCR